MIQIINKLLNSYILHVNKKPIKTFFKILLVFWVSITAFLYCFYYGYCYPISIVSWTVFFLILLIAPFYGFNKKINLERLIQDFGSRIGDKKIKFIHIIISIPIVSFIISNLLFLFIHLNKLADYRNLKNSILFFEFNIVQKLLFNYLFYLLLLLLFYALGRKILKIFKSSFDSKLEFFVFSVGVGAIPLMFGSLLIAVLGILYSYVVWIFILLLSIICLNEIKIIFKELGSIYLFFSFNNLFSAAKSAVFIFLFFILNFNYVANFKPVPITTDDLHTYFNSPNLFVHYHSYKPLMHFEGSNLSQNTEMIYAAIISMLDSSYMIHFQFLFFVLCLIGFYLFFKRIFGEKFAVLSVLLIYLIPWNTFYFNTVKVEFFFSFYSLLMAFSFLLWRETSNNKYLYILGVFSGICLGIKYNAFLLIIPLFLMAFIISLYRHKSILNAFKPLVMALALTVLFFSPWIIKNSVYFHNPVFPFSITKNEYGKYAFGNLKKNEPGYAVYAGERAKEIASIRHSQDNNKYSLKTVAKTIWNQSIGKEINRGSWINFGFVPLLIFPFYFLFLKDRRINLLLTLSFFYFILWYIFSPGRPWHGFFGIMLLYGMLPYIFLRNKSLACIHIFIMASIILSSPFIRVNNINYLVGSKDAESFISANIPYYETAKYINNLNLNPDEKILLAFDYRVAFIEENDKIMIVDPFLIKSGYSLAKGYEYFYQDLKNTYVNYVVLSLDQDTSYDAWLDFKKTNVEEYLRTYNNAVPSLYESKNNLKEFLSQYSNLIFSDNFYALYKIK